MSTPLPPREVYTKDLRGHLAANLEQLNKVGQPIRLTSHGRPRAVMVTPERYEQLLAMERRLAALDAKKKMATARAYGASDKKVIEMLDPPEMIPARADAREFMKRHELEDQPVLTMEEILDGPVRAEGGRIPMERDGDTTVIKVKLTDGEVDPDTLEAIKRGFGAVPGTKTHEALEKILEGAMEATAIDWGSSPTVPTEAELREQLRTALMDTGGLTEEDARQAVDRTFGSSSRRAAPPAAPPPPDLPSWAVLLDKHIESDRIYPEPPEPE